MATQASVHDSEPAKLDSPPTILCTMQPTTYTARAEKVPCRMGPIMLCALSSPPSTVTSTCWLPLIISHSDTSFVPLSRSVRPVMASKQQSFAPSTTLAPCVGKTCKRVSRAKALAAQLLVAHNREPPVHETDPPPRHARRRRGGEQLGRTPTRPVQL
eukprot:3936386-Rhodomonas_salina.1